MSRYKRTLAKFAINEGLREKERLVRETYEVAYDFCSPKDQRKISRAQSNLAEFIRDKAIERGARKPNIGEKTTLAILGSIGIHWEYLRREDAAE